MLNVRLRKQIEEERDKGMYLCTYVILDFWLTYEFICIEEVIILFEL